MSISAHVCLKRTSQWGRHATETTPGGEPGTADGRPAVRGVHAVQQAGMYLLLMVMGIVQHHP